MASEPTIDLESLLQPIEGANPSGRSLAYDADYDALREARRADDDAPQGDWQRAIKKADWDEVLRLGSSCLITKTKDLQIAAWMAEALAHLHQFAGLRDGLRLIHQLMDRFWDTLFPEIDDGDLDARCAPIEFLNGERLLPLIVRSVPLTDVLGEKRYSYHRYQESRATTNLGKRDAEAMEALIAEGKLTGELFDEAVALTPRAFYEARHADLMEAQQVCQALDQAVDAHYGRDAPSLGNLRKALDDCRKLIEPILATKRAQDPDAEPEETSEPIDAAEEPTGEDEPYSQPEAARAAPARRRARSSGGPIGSVEDAYDRVLEAAEYLRRNDPGHPSGYLVSRALRIGDLYALGRPPDPSGLSSPSSETRQALKRLASEGDWEGLLEQAEQAIGRPEGRAWLDAQRLAIGAMCNGSDADRSTAADACRNLLRAVLAEFPDLPNAELADDTPAANAETRAWLESEILPPPPPEPQEAPSAYAPPEPEPMVVPDATAAEPDAWPLALEDLRSGRPADAFGRLRRALGEAVTGRDKFRRKLQMAELCLLVNNRRVALPLLEELARQVDEFHLEQWEDEELCARVWGALYRCLKGLGSENGSADRLHQVYTRLCRLDIHQALSYGE
jgi:type VI secretion system protein ImpA